MKWNFVKWIELKNKKLKKLLFTKVKLPKTVHFSIKMKKLCLRRELIFKQVWYIGVLMFLKFFLVTTTHRKSFQYFKKYQHHHHQFQKKNWNLWTIYISEPVIQLKRLIKRIKLLSLGNHTISIQTSLNFNRFDSNRFSLTGRPALVKSTFYQVNKNH